jgi:hypothetical protein
MIVGSLGFPEGANVGASGARSVAVKLIDAVFLGVNRFFGPSL